MRLSRLLLGLCLVTSTVALSDVAFAAKKEAGASKAEELPTIEMTGLSELDSVFSKAKAIHETLDTTHAELTTSREKMNVSLGIATDAPVKTALADLNTKAGGKLKVAMKGNAPSLAATDAVPDNVQAGIDATNEMFGQAEKTGMKAKELLPEAEALVGACADFPGKVPDLVSDPLALAKALKTVNANVKAVRMTPEHINRIVSEVEMVWNDVKAVFPS